MTDGVHIHSLIFDAEDVINNLVSPSSLGECLCCFACIKYGLKEGNSSL